MIPRHAFASALTIVGCWHVADERAELLGDLSPDSWFAVDLPPGNHEFLAWHDRYANTHEFSVMKAILAARRVYDVAFVLRATDGFATSGE